jgi:hypothetical protein
MADLPFKIQNIDGDLQLEVDNAYDILKSRFQISGASSTIPIDLDKFDLLCNTGDVRVAFALNVNCAGGEFKLLFVDAHFIPNSKSRDGLPHDYFETQVWGFVKLKKDFGRILIRRETFADRIVGLVHHVELKFTDDKPFNNKFYVLANDSEKAVNALNWNFRNIIMAIDDVDIIIEILGDMLIIGNGKYPNAAQISNIAEIAGNISSLR